MVRKSVYKSMFSQSANCLFMCSDSISIVLSRLRVFASTISALAMLLFPAVAFTDIDWPKSHVVIVISMDGMRHDYPDRAAFPGFERMEAEGLRAEGLIPSFPSNTFPGHITLATGTTPDRHGIIDNKMWDKKRHESFKPEDTHLWLEAEPIWVSAERQGKRAATYYWLGSAGPWRGQAASYFKTPFKQMFSEQVKVDQIEQWLDFPVDKRPSLIMAYWHGADSVGHALGPGSPSVVRQIARQDKYLQSLQKIIDERDAWSYVTLLVVSDHGMASANSDKSKIIDLPLLFKQGGFKPYLKKSNAIAHLNFKVKAKAQRAFDFLKQQDNFITYYPDLDAQKIAKPTYKTMLNQKNRQAPVIHASRSGDLVLVAKPGYRFSASSFYSKKSFYSEDGLLDTVFAKLGAGIHGLASNNPDMAAIFFAQGRGIPNGSRLGKIEMIDIAPSIADLMGILPPKQAIGQSLFRFNKI